MEDMNLIIKFLTQNIKIILIQSRIESIILRNKY
jgi:hypothetical protein